MDVIKNFITNFSIMGIVQKVIVGILVAILVWALKWGIRKVSDPISKLTTLRQDMEKLKLTIDEDKEQTNHDRTLAREYMEDALRYRNEARTDRTATEQIREAAAHDREEMNKQVQSINSQLSSLQALLRLQAPADAKTPTDVNEEIRGDYLKSD